MKKPFFSIFNRLLPVLLIGLFIILAIAADVWPAKNYYFYSQLCVLETFARLDDFNWTRAFPFNAGYNYAESLPYLLFLKTIQCASSDRLLCMRLTSIAAGTATLIFIYLICNSLFSGIIALLVLFFLVTNPAFLETARAYGYMSLSHMFGILALLFAIISVRNRRWWLWVSLSAFAASLLIYLYAIVRIAVVPLIMAWYLISGRRGWRKLLLFSGAVVLILFAVVILYQVPARDIPKILFTNGYHEYAGGKDSYIDINNLLKHINRNTYTILGYIFCWRRSEFGTDISRSRLLNSVYLPLWIIGLITCGFKRRPGHIFAILMLLFFVLAPLPAGASPPRHIILVFYPLALLIGIGVYESYLYFIHFSSSKTGKRIVLMMFSIFFLGIGFFDVRYFLFQLSRPKYNVSNEQMFTIAEYILSQENNPMISYSEECLKYVLGNKYLINKLNMGRVMDTTKLKFMHCIYATLEAGNPLLYVHKYPVSEDFRQGIDWTKNQFPENCFISQIPNTELFIFNFSIPDSFSPNLLVSEHPEIRLSAGTIEDRWSYINNFTDGDPTTEVEIMPSLEDTPPWMILDFGNINKKVPRVIGATMADDNLNSAQYFRDIIISTSQNRKDWEILCRLKGEYNPRPGIWYQWSIPGDRPFQYYRLEFYEADGRPSHLVVIGNFGLFESKRHLLNLIHPEMIICLN